MSLYIKLVFIVSLLSVHIFAQDCQSEILIKTDVQKAKLFIDDKYEGEGNEFAIKLEPGTYSISIIEDIKRWNTRRLDDTLKINDCGDLKIVYELSKKIVLDSNPQNVYVISEDSIIGFTPLLLDDGFQTLLLKKPDYFDKIISQQEITSGIKPELQFIGQVKGESFYESTLFKFLIGTAIALGATTAYYKLEADKSFDEYQVTGDPALLEQTDKYDIISAATFVALQIDFGMIIYFFLTD